MACNSIALNGISGHCSTAVGGIVEVYIAEASDVSALTYDTSNNVITEITMVDNAKFKKYTFRPQSSDFTSEFSSDVATGSAYWTSTVNMVFARAEASKRLDILALVTDDCVAIVKDKNGNYIYMGDETPVVASGGSHETGTASTDRNAYTVSLQTESAQPPHFVNASIISGIVAE